MAVRVFAFLWGFFEATVFFLVPDIWLTAVALKEKRADVIYALIWSLAGALLGGSLVYAWAAHRPGEAFAWFQHLPGISERLVQDVRQGVVREGAMSMLKGIFRGIPYKLFAAAYGEQGEGVALFLFVSLIVRASRFAFSMAAAAGIRVLGSRFVRRWEMRRWIIHGLFWSVFCAVYFFYFGYIFPARGRVACGVL